MLGRVLWVFVKCDKLKQRIENFFTLTAGLSDGKCTITEPEA